MFKYATRRQFSVSPMIFLVAMIIGALVFVCALGYQNDFIAGLVR